MSFIAQDFGLLNVIAILDGRTQATIRNHFPLSRKLENRVKVITMDMFSPYYQLAKQAENSFPDCFTLKCKNCTRSAFISCNTLVCYEPCPYSNYESIRQKIRTNTGALKRYWKLIQQDSRKLSDKRFYRPYVSNAFD